jgi:putative transposase
VKYVFMRAHKSEFHLSVMCSALNISRSGFYYWLNRSEKLNSRQQEQQRLDEHVADAFQLEKGRSGARRLVHRLVKQAHGYNRKTVAASLKRQGWQAKTARKFKATTQSNHNLPVAENLLQQNFHASQPNQKWAGDITYLWTEEGWLNLAVVSNLYSRKVISWSMSERMTANLVCDALQMALFRCKHPKGVIVHSDRGSQYCFSRSSNIATRPPINMQHECKRLLLR